MYKPSDDALRGKGEGNKTYIYDQYVQAEYETKEEFRQIPRDRQLLRRERNRWFSRKAIGEKLLPFVEKFGMAILLCFPPKITIATIDRWPALRPRLTVHGLVNGPNHAVFQKMCDVLNDHVTDLIDAGDTSVMRVVKKVARRMRKELSDFWASTP